MVVCVASSASFPSVLQSRQRLGRIVRDAGSIQALARQHASSDGLVGKLWTPAGPTGRYRLQGLVLVEVAWSRTSNRPSMAVPNKADHGSWNSRQSTSKVNVYLAAVVVRDQVDGLCYAKASTAVRVPNGCLPGGYLA